MSEAGQHMSECVDANNATKFSWQPLVRDCLYDLQVRFNLFPASYAHFSWIDRVHGFGQQCESPFWLRRISLSLLRLRELENSFDFDFYNRAKRIALLEASVLERAAKLMAGLLMRDRLKHAILRSEMEAIEKAIGRETHRFALTWTGDIPTLSAALQHPNESFHDQEKWTQRAVKLISGLLPESSPGTLTRLMFKFPYEWSKYPRIVITDEDHEKLIGLFISIIRKAEPESAWLFQ
jgi:hypothetical protein